ncbi:pyridoxal phosphate-dependent decarboxylase family protein [Streptomyces avicenniae]|uniref:pyridoxal phosphate-dependent decarboxylase family protein n=1 Tax=Streptomyces avicenniae TaxID=500153 RepID=UPI00069A34BC|nr:aminotransferase class V-fold PLP-dependent enzyme [Streptomyces avicenniae]
MDLHHWLGRAVDTHAAWADGHGPRPGHPALAVDDEALSTAFAELAGRLGTSYPFFHPRYAGQMLKPPHPVAVTGYLAAMLVNPNNHALDGGPATSALEEEVVAALATMVGFPGDHLGHLTGGGTVANLEALFVARETHPGKGIAYSAESHYTHARMCHLLGVEGHAVPTDDRGRMDVAALERLLDGGRIGTVVVTTGTTGLGAVDPVHRVLDLTEPAGVRVHVDAAYGGFFALLADEVPHGTPLVDPAPWRALRRCDSVVVDPHKHGMQPYGCGAVLFRDPSVQRFYRHDSPYTYFTSSRPHLGEISLECSRAGASAAALWLTLRLFPLTRDGLGEVVAAGRRTALRWAERIAASPHLDLFQPPELDIVTYHPRVNPPSLKRITAASEHVLRAGMRGGQEDPVYVSTARIGADAFAARRGDAVVDAEETAVLRSVLMKPEAEPYLDRLHGRVEELASAACRDGELP